MKLEEAGLRIRPWGLKSALRDLDDLHDDIVFMIRRAAYVDEIRSVALRERRIGWAALVLGIAALIWAAWDGLSLHARLAHVAEAAVLLGSALWFHVMIKRTRYARAHPFTPER
jgi:hypothetical protein